MHKMLVLGLILGLIGCDQMHQGGKETLRSDNESLVADTEREEKVKALRNAFADALENNLPAKAQEAVDELEKLDARVSEKDMERFHGIKQELDETRSLFNEAVRSMDLAASRDRLAKLEDMKVDTSAQMTKLQQVETHHLQAGYPHFQNVKYAPRDIGWMESQAEAGDQFAQTNLGILYFEGISVSTNYGRAFDLLTQAAQKNQALAQVFLGQLYTEGKGVTQSAKKGFQWVRKAAKQGFAIGQFVLATFYLEGTGVQKSEKTAEQWLQKAAKQDNQMAKELLAKIEAAKTGKKEQETGKDHLHVWAVNGVEFTMAEIPAGDFIMGSPETESTMSSIRETQHQVTISRPFLIGQMEVTQALFEAVMGHNPSYFKNPQFPVENVSWKDAISFIEKLNQIIDDGTVFRLPTEAEWEYACRAGTKGAYAGNLDNMAKYRQTANGSTGVVGNLLPNAWDLYDMHGNVYEWCFDWMSTYPLTPVTDPKVEKVSKQRIYRGGGWESFGKDLRSAARGLGRPDEKANTVGFRLACDLPQKVEEKEPRDTKTSKK